MTDKDIDDGLNALLAQAKATQPAASDALLARINADANRVQPRPAPSRPTLWRQLLDMAPTRQSWQLAGGLAVAAIAGIYIGFANPTIIPSWANDEMTADISDLFVSDTAFFDEG